MTGVVLLIAAVLAQRASAASLHYRVGIGDGAKDTDGVVFRVLAIASGTTNELARDSWRECAWHERNVDLTAYKGKEVLLRFVTEPGPTTTYDWACWGEPRILDGKTLLTDLTACRIWRSGIVHDGRVESPLDAETTGATFRLGTYTCGRTALRGFMAHPPYRGRLSGGAAFAEFKIVVGATAPPETYRQPLPAQPDETSPFPPGTAGCFRIAHSPLIDGELGDWPERFAQAALTVRDRRQLTLEHISFKPGWKAGWQGPRDLSASFRVAWDDRCLYVAQIRRDDVFQSGDTMSAHFRGSDALRIGVGPAESPGGSPTHALLIAVNPEGETDAPMVHVFRVAGNESEAIAESGVRVAPRVYDGGQIIEAAIPFSTIGIQPRAGTLLRFQLAMTDSDTPMECHYEMAWNPVDHADADRPAAFGALTLCEDTFAWLELPRLAYAVGESPTPALHWFPAASGTGRVSIEMTGWDPRTVSGGVWRREALADGAVFALPAVASAGALPLSYTLHAGRDVTRGTWVLTGIADRPRRSLEAVMPPATPRLRPSLYAGGFTNRVATSGERYALTYRGTDGELAYICRPGAGLDIEVQADGRSIYHSAAATGPVPADGGDAPALDPTSVTTEDDALCYRCTGANGTTVSWRLTISGRTLIVEVVSTRGAFEAFRGPLHGMEGEPVAIPYLEPRMGIRRHAGYYWSSYPDWTVTGCSRIDRFGDTVYEPKTDGTRNALRERVLTTVAPDMAEAFPNLPNPPSPYRKTLASKVVLDWWGWPGTFAAGARYLEALKGYGVDELAIIYHVWQRHGYDNGLPEHVPAMPDMGGDDGLRELGTTARRLGYLFALHENYIDYYPNYPHYTDEAVAVDSRGAKIDAWYMPSTGIQSFRLKPSWIERYARDQSPQAHARYATTAAYLDVQSVNLPWQIDFDAAAPGAGSMRYAFEQIDRLFAFMRATHGGPLFGEGNWHSLWAGRVDGCEAQVGSRGGELEPVLVDFDLLKIHPLAVNHGMGYYSRWHRARHGTLTDAELDRYRAQELAYGHAGFLNTPVFDNLSALLREYYLVQPVQSRYALAKPAAIEYGFGGERWVSAEVAVRTDAPRRIHVAYDNGLELWVNDQRGDWTIAEQTLPPDGFLAQGAGVRSMTARFGACVGDYAETAERIFADPRTGNARYSHARASLDVKPLPPTVDFPAPDRMRITYRWEPGAETIGTNFAVFVHFTDRDGRVLWQDDHGPAVPTARWRSGEVVATGPRDVAIPAGVGDGEYDIRVGLFTAQGGRMTLDGHDDGEQRYSIGRVQLRAGKAAYQPPRAAVRATGNAPGTIVDFGTVATDVALVLTRGDRHLDIMPIPHGAAGEVRLRLDGLIGEAAAVARIGVAAVGADDTPLTVDVPVARDGALATVTMRVPQAWRYRVTW